MHLKFLVPLALLLASSASAATVPPTVGVTKARQACANGEIIHTSTMTHEGKEVKMSVKSCPGMTSLTEEPGTAVAAKRADQPEKRDYVLYDLYCDTSTYCYELGQPALLDDCELLRQSLSGMPGTFLSGAHTLTTWFINNGRCDYTFYNFDNYNYDVSFFAFANLGYNIAYSCIVGTGYGSGDCSSSGAPGDAYAVQFWDPLNN